MTQDQAAQQKLEKDDVIWLNDIKKCRDIVFEILRFGVNQQQIKKIICLLALELEDRDLMISIKNIVEPSDDSESSEQSSDNSQAKLVYPGGIEDE